MENDPKKPERDWDSYYRQRAPGEIPWYFDDLDPDLDMVLANRKLKSGKFLDLGSGPGTQASQLAKRGFEAIGCDISQTAVDQAKTRFPEVSFVRDDILKSNLPSFTFDFVFDRGCFHVFSPEHVESYLFHVANVLKVGGLLFLKCFSQDELGKHQGPRRFSHAEIYEIFDSKFNIESLVDTTYQGTLSIPPKALFVVMMKK
jgi:SAM-dependent methyltransferase